MQSPEAICSESGVEYELCTKTHQRMTAVGEAVKNGCGFHELPNDTVA